jgi:5-methylcytosine-specific restriction protein A
VSLNTTDRRIMGRKLQNIRASHFAQFPLCVNCQLNGKVSLATELDHIEPICKGGKDVESNRQGLCSPCHAEKTAQDMGYAPPVATGPDGYPL